MDINFLTGRKWMMALFLCFMGSALVFSLSDDDFKDGFKALNAKYSESESRKEGILL